MQKKLACLLLAALIGVVPLLLTSGCAVTSGRETAGEYADDKAITAKAKAALARDDVVKAHQVNVTTFQGIVQLSGFVETQEQKDRASEVVREISGVREVHNDLIVPTGR